MKMNSQTAEEVLRHLGEDIKRPGYEMIYGVFIGSSSGYKEVSARLGETPHDYIWRASDVLGDIVIENLKTNMMGYINYALPTTLTTECFFDGGDEGEHTVIQTELDVYNNVESIGGIEFAEFPDEVVMRLCMRMDTVPYEVLNDKDDVFLLAYAWNPKEPDQTIHRVVPLFHYLEALLTNEKR